MSHAEVLYEQASAAAWETCPFFMEIGLLVVSKWPWTHTIHGGHKLLCNNFGGFSRSGYSRRRGGPRLFMYAVLFIEMFLEIMTIPIFNLQFASK
ncbi:hypothetical protein PPE_05015 [Paenibacillus polymyxa E681]|nr:hypothetical protein PPE_05015 [Paenibacillus polymyxa E681]